MRVSRTRVTIRQTHGPEHSRRANTSFSRVGAEAWKQAALKKAARGSTVPSSRAPFGSEPQGRRQAEGSPPPNGYFPGKPTCLRASRRQARQRGIRLRNSGFLRLGPPSSTLSLNCRIPSPEIEIAHLAESEIVFGVLVGNDVRDSCEMIIICDDCFTSVNKSGNGVRHVAGVS